MKLDFLKSVTTIGLFFLSALCNRALAEKYTPTLDSPSIIHLQPQSSPISISTAEFLEDKSKTVDFNSLRSLESKDPSIWKSTSKFNFGYTASRYWIRFQLQNSGDQDCRWTFELGYPLIQKVQVHFVDAQGRDSKFETGRFAPFSDREIEYRSFLFPFELSKNSTKTVYMMLESTGTMRAPMRVFSEKSIIPTIENQSLGLGLYYGAMAALVFYNLFLFFVLRDKNYIFYVLYAASFALMQSSLSGHAYQYLWSNGLYWNRISVPFLVGFSFFFLSIFTKSLLETKKYTPKSDFLLNLLGCLSFALGTLSIIHYGIEANKFASIMVSYAPLLVFPAVFFRIKHGFRPAIYYAIAFLAFFIGSAAVASKDLGLLPLNFVTTYGMHLGSVFEALLFSLALAYRVRLLREEKLISELKIEKTQRQLKEQTAQLENERLLSTFAAQVAHDIRSPLAALGTLETELATLPEEKRLMLRSAINRIKDIANNLLEKNRSLTRKVAPSATSPTESEPKSVLLISSVIDPLITEKRLQFRSKLGIEIEARMDASSYGLFAEIQLIEFKRVVSNLINNSVEALSDQGRTTVKLTSNPDSIQVSVSDNGKGIPPDVLPKLMQKGETHGKEGGSGLGLFHAKTSVENWKGTLSITSTVGKGTTVSIQLPKSPAPDWFMPVLILKQNSKVVILDDDSSIHQVWQGRFEAMNLANQGIEMLHFSTPLQIEEWATSHTSLQDEVLYLCDYELLGESTNGLQLIEKLAIQSKSVLVTSRYEEPAIRKQCETLGVKLIPKGMAGFVPIHVKAPLVRPDAILLDDDNLVHMTWASVAKQNQKSLLSFYDPSTFFEALTKIDTTTPVYIDSNLGNNSKGEDLVGRVVGLGFKHVYLATGYEPETLAHVPGISGVVGKEVAEVLCN